MSRLCTLCQPPDGASAYKLQRGCAETACREWRCPPAAPPLAAAAAAGANTLYLLCARFSPVPQLPQLQYPLPRQWRRGGGRFHRGAGRACLSAAMVSWPLTLLTPCLTAAPAAVQIPNIEGRQYPPELAGGQRASQWVFSQTLCGSHAVGWQAAALPASRPAAIHPNPSKLACCA